MMEDTAPLSTGYQAQKPPNIWFISMSGIDPRTLERNTLWVIQAAGTSGTGAIHYNPNAQQQDVLSQKEERKHILQIRKRPTCSKQFPYPPSPLYIQGKEARKVIFEEIRVHGVVSLHCITSVTGVELPGEL